MPPLPLLVFLQRLNRAKTYALFGLTMLLATTALWSFLGAKLQQANADQLVNAYLFQNGNTLHGAIFPSQHSFLLKWPIFYLVKLLGYSAASFIAVTMGIVVATVGGLAALLWRIERRPYVFGTICLALASMLLLIPAQPYAGALLPVNMAMLTTRNLEYVVYVAAVILLMRIRSLKTWQFWCGVGLLSLVFASDGLFISLSIGGALLALITYATFKRWDLVSLATNWLLAGLFAVVIALSGIAIINLTGLTHISGQVLSPYTVSSSGKSVALGTTYAAAGLLTNSGANPSFDATTLAQIAPRAWHHLVGLGAASYIVNISLFITGLVVCGRLLFLSILRPSPKKKPAANRVEQGNGYNLSLALIWSTLAGLGAFIVTNHYYVVDARYLGISFFTLAIAVVYYASKRQFVQRYAAALGIIMLVSTACGIVVAVQNYHAQAAALRDISARNATVAEAMLNRHVTTLVGDYWRVVPTNLQAQSKLNIVPLSNCTQLRSVLSSQAWQPNLSHNRFAYLLSFDKGLTDYPQCSIDQVVAAYGKPNASFLIAGRLSHPQELLLFYDHGAHPSKTAPKAPATSISSTILPIALADLTNTTCDQVGVMNIVAHQDDDLLFMNPDLQHDIKAKRCVRTIYVTAGDAGKGQSYWLSRQQGSEAAYSSMLGDPTNQVWIQKVIKLSDNSYVTIANPKGNSRISLIFMNLPDGGLKGDGFNGPYGSESIERLSERQIATIHTVDGQSSYTSTQLVTALTQLMLAYQPAEIRTQSAQSSKDYPDHPDHRVTGQFATQAYQKYELVHFNDTVSVPLIFYVGYPVRDQPANVTGSDASQKEAAFLAYARFDGGVCQTVDQCSKVATYGSYLTREYQAAQ